MASCYGAEGLKANMFRSSTIQQGVIHSFCIFILHLFIPFLCRFRALNYRRPFALKTLTTATLYSSLLDTELSLHAFVSVLIVIYSR